MRRNKGVFIAIGFVGAAILLWLRPDEPRSRAKLKAIFRSEFGIAPNSAVIHIQARSVSVGDSWSRWIRFTPDPATVSNIVGNGWLVSSNRTAGGNWSAHWSQSLEKYNPNAPRWWVRLTNDHAVVYYQTNHPADYAGFRYLWIDTTNGWAYAECAAWH